MDRRLSSCKISRRELLALPLAAAVVGCRRPPYRPEDFAVPAQSPVALLPAASYEENLADVILRGLSVLAVNVRGKRVLLKPNVVEYENGSAINTNPLLVAAAAEAMLRSGAAAVSVGEGPGHRRDVEYLLTSSGLSDFLKDLRVPFIDLNHDDVRRTALRSWFTGLRELLLPVSLADADLVVSMPKLKTHHWAGMTCGMKNLFGVVPGAVYGWPKNFLHAHGVAQSILDLTATIRPALTIVDAIDAMEGDGPIMGRRRHVGTVAMGADVVAVDATCARMIGFEPARLPYLDEAGRFFGNVSPSRIVQRGEPLGRYATRFDIIETMRSLQADR